MMYTKEDMCVIILNKNVVLAAVEVYDMKHCQRHNGPEVEFILPK